MTLVWLAAAFIGGVFAGSSVTFGTMPLLVAAVLAASSALVAWRLGPMRLGLLLVLCFLLGMGRAETARVRIGPGDAAYYNGQTVTLTGYVNTEPDIRDKGNNYVLTIDHMIHGSRTIAIRGQVEMHTAPSQVLNEGDEIQFTGLLTTPANSPTVPYRSILANRGIYSEMAFPKLFVTGHVSLGLVGIADDMRRWIENSISTSMPEPEATFLIAIVIGARSAQLGNLAPVLIQTGLIHLIAISGIKIAIVAGTVSEFARRIFSRTPRLMVSVSVLLGYWLVSGATVAGLRASIMWLLVFIAAYLGRPTYALVSLGIAVSAMLAVTPSLLWDTGFELTAIGTAAIVAFSPPLQRATSKLPGFLAASLSTTTAAQVGVLPVQVASFHVVSPISLAANAIVLPFIPLTMVAGFADAIVPHPPFAGVAYALVHILIFIARWAAGLSTATTLSSLPMPVSLSYYAVLLALAAVAWRVRASIVTHRRGEWFFGLAVAAIGLGFVMHSPAPRDGVFFITNGDALIVSRGQHVLIDGGASGAKLLVGLGNRLRFPDDRLDVVIDTSPQAKNVAALLEVAQHVMIGTVLDPGLQYPSQTYGRWRGWLDSHHVATLNLRSGVIVRGHGFTIRVLAPDAIYSNPKDGTGALLITAGNRRILYLGNASPTEQEDLPFETHVNLQVRTIIAAVPIDPILAQATGDAHIVRPVAGGYLGFGSRP